MSHASRSNQHTRRRELYPCSGCKTRSLKCKVDVRSGRCGECVRRGRKCDLVVTSGEFRKSAQHRNRLRKDLKASLDNEERLFQELEKERAKTRRLQTQLEFAEKREGDAIEREFASIEEQEEMERQLQDNHVPVEVDVSLDVPLADDGCSFEFVSIPETIGIAEATADSS
ncbi:hypothetical protein K402DRAFT_397896 [Aulographum hederae CBS 113979]|uniref:Zn(2)-C6 fungal-type domain-containing protein n=1 Tax=Aulographum hederae CBS 113979 TaxID=1176131 RepID=A0A6G1GMJ6_9PEZI|nr:hypothetical protein K402DRAFT_397896 [Aulographum hederae CBS 113979]